MLSLFRILSALRVCVYVCVFLPTFWHRAATDSSETTSESGKASIRLKIGALFDVRARHLIDAFQKAVDVHNSEELDPGKAHHWEDLGLLRRRKDVIKIVFEPVITFVDVTDSFAVSNAMCDLIAHDVITIVGVTNASSLPTIQSYSATFHVPFLSLGSSQNVTSSAPFQLSLRPPVMAAVVDLLQHQGCASALYVYDSDDGLMRIQDLFQAINIRELYLELDVRRIGDKVHVTEISKIIGSLHPRREVCLVLDVERLDVTAVVNVFAAGAPTVKDILLVTLDAEIMLNAIVLASERRPPARFNISGLQLVPSLQPSHSVQIYPHFHHHHHSLHRWSPTQTTVVQFEQHQRIPRQLSKDFQRSTQEEVSSKHLQDSDFESAAGKTQPRTRGYKTEQQTEKSQSEFGNGGPRSTSADFTALTGQGPETRSKASAPQTGQRPSSEALIVDCLKVLTTALADLWDTLGDVFESTSDVNQEDISIKCTNFVVEKKQYGTDLMEALRLVHIHGETRYINFDTSGRREDYSLSVLSVRAGTKMVRNEGEWSSVSGLTSNSWSSDGVRSYTIFGNMSGQAGRRVFLGVME